MEKKLFTLLFILFISSAATKTKAQDIVSDAARKEASTLHLKNTVIIIDGKSFDYRILKHYSEAQLRSLSSVKRNQIHFIYTESYKVSDLGNCSSMKITDIDIAKLGAYRQENASTVIEVGDDCKVHVELISSTLLKQKMEELKK